MRTLRKAFAAGLIVILVISYASMTYARTDSIVTHATVVILPRSDKDVPLNEGLTESTIQNDIQNEGMITRIEMIETPYGEKVLYTMIGAL